MSKRAAPLLTCALVLLAGFLAAGCGRAAPGEPTRAVATAAPLPTEQPLTATASATASATAHPSPTASSTARPTETPTNTTLPTETPTPRPFAVVRDAFAGVYAGPGPVFDTLITLTKGVPIDLIGRDETGSWFYVDLLLGQAGWISAEAVAFDGDPEGLEVLETPIVPTRTPTPGSPPAIYFDSTVGAKKLYLLNFKLFENVVVTVAKIDDPTSGESRNCTASDPVQTVCKLWWAKFVAGTTYIITAIGDQGSFAQITYTP